ncbi:Auxin responsive SAUR protein [Corchorus capsularis]|uniref:Auxin responsive SAUR protein n=1 Tax=Corchorus capsularis TaxID=210143 RepID=A0A1R3I0H2_COCAP|nr:Auxin responsive SAUR protein [Corchorus capsularis]
MVILRPWRRENFPIIPKKKYCHDNEDEEMPRESLLTEDLELSDGSSRGSRDPKYVPKGFVAVYVGTELRRFVIPTSYLSMPEFKVLMDKAAEEFGFEQEGGLKIPCDEQDFEHILHNCTTLDRMSKNKKI